MIAEAHLRRQLTLPGLRGGFEASRPYDPIRLIWSVSLLRQRVPRKPKQLSNLPVKLGFLIETYRSR